MTAILTGLLGGSFNPAHGAHRAITRFAIDALGLDEAWWLVSPGNPLKPHKGMAPLPARVRAAKTMARRLPVKVSAIERRFGTVYTIDTLRALKRRFPKRRFVWLMGADNLAQFHQWRQWREIAREMPIAVIARPGYDDGALASPAMAWLRRYRAPAAGMSKRGEWSVPALLLLRFDPDPRSATDIRRADPDWARRFTGATPRDQVTLDLIRDTNLAEGA